jgi:hypothetical protein
MAKEKGYTNHAAQDKQVKPDRISPFPSTPASLPTSQALQLAGALLSSLHK